MPMTGQFKSAVDEKRSPEITQVAEHEKTKTEYGLQVLQKLLIQKPEHVPLRQGKIFDLRMKQPELWNNKLKYCSTSI